MSIDVLDLDGTSRSYDLPFERTTPPVSDRIPPDGKYLVGISADGENAAGGSC
jgi:hypothetical protein